MIMLTKHEELILLSICKLKENAYGVPIRKNIMDITGKPINYGSLCNTLYALVKKGYIESRESEPLAQKGGRRKVIYSMTTDGQKALKHSFEVYQQSWKEVPKFVFEG
jgi:PadR family transcriptional regulator PadR